MGQKWPAVGISTLPDPDGKMEISHFHHFRLVSFEEYRVSYDIHDSIFPSHLPEDGILFLILISLSPGNLLFFISFRLLLFLSREMSGRLRALGNQPRDRGRAIRKIHIKTPH